MCQEVSREVIATQPLGLFGVAGEARLAADLGKSAQLLAARVEFRPLTAGLGAGGFASKLKSQAPKLKQTPNVKTQIRNANLADTADRDLVF